MKNNDNTQRQSAPTGAREPASEQQADRPLGDAACSDSFLNARGWSVFSSEAAREIASNQAHFDRDDEAIERLSRRSTLDLPAFRNAVENRFSGAVFEEYVSSDSGDQSFKLRLIAEDFGYVLANVRELLLSGVVTHCSLDLVSVGSLISSERPSDGTAAPEVGNTNDQNGGCHPRLVRFFDSGMHPTPITDNFELWWVEHGSQCLRMSEKLE
jgi:hypothetical protein